MVDGSAAADDLSVVILHDLAQVHRGHHAVGGRVHARAVDAIHVEDGGVERVAQLILPAEMGENAPADGIGLVFQRAVRPAVALAEVDAAQMSQQAGDGAHEAALQVGLDQRGGERIIDEALFEVDGDPLTVARVPAA